MNKWKGLVYGIVYGLFITPSKRMISFAEIGLRISLDQYNIIF